MTQNTQIEALKPCPFCGCTDVSNNDDGDYQWFECDWCHATSGFDPDPEFEGLHPSFHWNRRALREAPVPSEEPVAWQTRQKPTGAEHWGGWHFGRTTGDREGWDVEERPLFASPAVAPVAVSVKPLRWMLCKALGGGLKWIAMDPFGNEFARIDEGDLGEAEINARKAAAQEKYERILSSIIPATTGGEDACATEGCGKPAAVHFIRGDVGSYFCAACYKRVHAGETERLAALAQDTAATPPSDTEEPRS